MRKLMMILCLCLLACSADAGMLQMGGGVAAGGTEIIGWETQGANANGSTDNYSYCTKIQETPAHNGTIQSLTITMKVEGGTSATHFSIYNHDATNDIPSTVVANSATANMAIAATSATDYTHTYTGTKPTVTSGTQYWICICNGAAANPYFYYTNTAGYRMTYKPITYETYPDYAGTATVINNRGFGKAYFSYDY